MKGLEKFVRENREWFDEQEPVEGHRERFLKKLESEVNNDAKKRKREMIILSASSAAAVLIAGIILFGHGVFRSQEDEFEKIHIEYLEEVRKYGEEIEDLSYLINGERDGYGMFFLNISEDEPIPFLAQLPDELDRSEKALLLKEYYNQKLNGLKQMKLLMSEQLTIDD